MIRTLTSRLHCFDFFHLRPELLQRAAPDRLNMLQLLFAGEELITYDLVTPREPAEYVLGEGFCFVLADPGCDFVRQMW